MNLVLLISAGLIVTMFGLFSIVSINENEPRAAGRLSFLGIVSSLPFLIVVFFPFGFNEQVGIILIAFILLFLILLVIPLGSGKYRQPTPTKRIDERDIMFSRNELKPGSKEFQEYYEKNPLKKELDDHWRKEPGLLKQGSLQHNPILFASALASMETSDIFKKDVDGMVSETMTELDKHQMTTYLKSWILKLGALDVGITELKDYHLYTHGGRGDRHGKSYDRKHQYAIAFSVEMNDEMVAAAPGPTIVMESCQQYLEMGRIAIQVGKFIRKLGYEARAHVDGNYEVICPLVARDAGLGEIGRMGLLMTPKQGPRVRVGVVTTNIPLINDDPLDDYSVIDFCKKCKKCAEVCPGNAISKNDMETIDGVVRWKINQENCFTVWCKLGTDCGRCVSVCPYSHPDNLMHNIIRRGIKNSVMFRLFAHWMDDFIYGKKPSVSEAPGWIQNILR